MSARMLGEAEGYSLLKANGIPIPEHRVVRTVAEAVQAAEEIGFPVAVKVVSPQVVHKSDVGGVVTGVADVKEVKNAFKKIKRSVRERKPGADVKGMIVEEQMPSGLELLVGGKTDPSFGKVITFGLGGELVELMSDVSIRVLPVSGDEIRRMMREVRGYALIEGYRGEQPKDERSLLRIIQRVCKMFYEDDRIVEFDINPLILYEKGGCAVDARIYVSESVTRIEKKKDSEISQKMFNPKSIAVIGASSTPGKVGYAVFRNLLEFPGKLYAVNPGKKEILGRKAYPSISSIEDKVDLAVIAIPAAKVPEAIEQAGRKGVGLAVVISAGFREIGEQGAALEEEVLRSAKKYNVKIIGPNCLGIILPHRSINATFDPVSPRPGNLAFISQSGAIITTVVDLALREHRGFSAIVSVGNQADLGFDEFLRFARGDANTRTIVLYIEEIKDGQSFLNVVRDVTKKKHVVAIKSGSSKRGQKAASSHTGSLAGNFEVYMAAFRQAGIISVHSLEDAFQVGELLASEDYPKGNRAVIITNAGGFAVLASDYAEKNNIEVADLQEQILNELNSCLTEEWSHENPIDIVGDGGADRYARVFDIMIKNQDAWDIAFIIAVPSAVLDPRQLAKEVARFSRSTHKMIVGCLLGGNSMRGGVGVLREAFIPNFHELEEAFRIVGEALSQGPTSR